jgi:hypothetical protein
VLTQEKRSPRATPAGSAPEGALHAAATGHLRSASVFDGIFTSASGSRDAKRHGLGARRPFLASAAAVQRSRPVSRDAGRGRTRLGACHLRIYGSVTAPMSGKTRRSSRTAITFAASRAPLETAGCRVLRFPYGSSSEVRGAKRALAESCIDRVTRRNRPIPRSRRCCPATGCRRSRCYCPADRPDSRAPGCAESCCRECRRRSPDRCCRRSCSG